MSARLPVSHWALSPMLDAEAAVLVGLYLWCARQRWPSWRTGSFLAGVLCVLVALQSGIDAFDDRLLSAHMAQHMLLLMVAPPLLLAGRPVTLALRTLPARRRRILAGALGSVGGLTHPLTCLAAFYLLVPLTHLPSVYDATLRDPLLHELEHGLYLLSGVLLWWPLLDGDPVPRRRLSGVGKLGYLMAAMPPMAGVGAYLNRLPTVLYPPYRAPAHALGANAVVDQQQAGAIMWVGGSVIMVAVGLCLAVAALTTEERRQRARDARARMAVGSERGAVR